MSITTVETSHQLKEGSGVAKTIGTWGAMLFGIHCISLSSSGFIPYSWVASVWPGANIATLLVIAMGCSILHGLCYAAIGTIIPRSGADYVMASRVFNPWLAFVSSWILVIFSGIVVGSLIAWIPKSAVPALLVPIDMIFGTSWGNQVAHFSSSPLGTFVIGSVFVMITFICVTKNNKWNVSIMRIGFWLMLIAWAIILVTLAVHSPTDFETAWNRVMINQGDLGEFKNRINIATNAGMIINDSFTKTTAAGLIMGFWIYYGYYIPTFFAKEVKSDNKKGLTLILASLGSIAITGGIFILGDILLENLVSNKWLAAEGYIFNNPAAVESAIGKPVAGYPWITFYAGILLGNSWVGIFLLFFIAVAWIWSLVNLAQTYFFYTSRIILSWSNDDLLPRFFKRKTLKNNVPIYCLLAVALLSFYGIWDASYNNGILSSQLTFAFFAVITQLVSVLALIIFPYRWKLQFSQAPKFFKGKFLGLYWITWVSIVTFLYLGWIVYASFAYPAAGISNPSATLKLLLIIALLGVVVFALAWIRLRKANLYKAKFQSIPNG